MGLDHEDAAVKNFLSLFLSHGAPTLALATQDVTYAFLQRLGREWPKPKAVIVTSPHWMMRGFAVKSPARYRTWHDFGGFPDALYQLQYTPTGDEALAARVLEAIDRAGLPTARVDDARLDHGVWVPLMLMWPQADVPIVQVSTAPGDPAAHWALGEALRPFAEEGYPVIGSGGIVHNLRELFDPAAPAPTWAAEFVAWIQQQLAAGDTQALIDYRRRAPHAARAHPTEDHLLPLFTAAGAGGGVEGQHTGFTLGSLGMAAYGFE
jgi:4,5-DOPA dioxygenase extradiol